MDQVFPEHDTLFIKVGIFGKASKEVLLELSSSDTINDISAETLTELLSETNINRLGIKLAKQLKTSASHSFGVDFAQETFTFCYDPC